MNIDKKEMRNIYDDIMTWEPKYPNFGQNLFWCYANWQAIYAVVKTGEDKIGKKFYMLRSHFYKKFTEGKQKISDLSLFNRIKVNSDGFCFYCHQEMPKNQLTADHVFPRIKGGVNNMDNIIYVCKSCNSSKGKRDLIEWFLLFRETLPSPFVLGHYLRDTYQYAIENDLMDKPWEDILNMQLPFNPRCMFVLLHDDIRNYYFNIVLSNRDAEDFHK